MKAIGNYSQEINADVIVMGILGRAGIPGLIIGHTAEAFFTRDTGIEHRGKIPGALFQTLPEPDYFV